MQKVETILWVVLAVLVGLPLIAFVAALLLGGFSAGVLLAAIFLEVVLVIILLIPGAINGGLAWGMGKVNGKAGEGLRAVGSGINRGERLVERGASYTARPDIWLYSRVAWLRGFWNGLRRPRHQQS